MRYSENVRVLTKGYNYKIPISWKVHTESQYRTLEVGISDDGKANNVVPGVEYVKEILQNEKNLNKKKLPPLYFNLLNKQKEIYYEDDVTVNKSEIDKDRESTFVQ